MKVTMLTKRVTVNVLAHRASQALEEFLNTQECEGCDVLSAQVTLVTTPVDALKKTLEFIRETDTPMLGYNSIEHLDAETIKQHGYKVWIVSADLEQAIDFTKPVEGVEEPGVIGAGLESGATESPVPDASNFLQKEDGWYFRGVDEDKYGPYNSYEEARVARAEYSKWVENGKPV